MKKKSLKETNPYLKDPELREALFNLSVSSSTAVEGALTKYPKLSKSLEKRLKSLKDMNPYLKDPKKYEVPLLANVITSSAVEGIRVTPAQLQKKNPKGKHS